VTQNLPVLPFASFSHSPSTAHLSSPNVTNDSFFVSDSIAEFQHAESFRPSTFFAISLIRVQNLHNEWIKDIP
jgi:hypothetical protein